MAHKGRLDQATIVEAAVKLVDEEGLAQLTLGRLAERLGVRTPSLYNHIDGLPELKCKMACYCLRELLDRILRTTIGKSQAEAVLAIATTYRAYARETPGRYTLTLQAPGFEDRELDALARQLVEMLQAVLAPFGLTEEETIHAIRGLRSIVQGFSDLEIAGGFAMSVGMDASFHWLIKLFIAGLRRPAGSDQRTEEDGYYGYLS